jgi:hypothetical protein
MLTVCVVAVLLATSVFAATGCGKSSSPTGTTAGAQPATSAAPQTTASDVASSGSANGKALTRDAFIAEADAICKRIVAQRAAANGRLKSQQDLARQVALLAVYEQGALTTLSGLRPPGSMEGEWQRIAALVRRLAAETTKFGDDVKEGRVKFGYTQVFPVVVAIESKIAAAARLAGLEDCTAI